MNFSNHHCLFKLFCAVWEGRVKTFTISQLSLFTRDLRLVLQAQGAQLIAWTMVVKRPPNGCKFTHHYSAVKLMGTIMSLFAAGEGGSHTWLCAAFHTRHDGVPAPGSPNLPPKPFSLLPAAFLAFSPSSSQLLLPDPRWLLVPAGVLQNSRASASMCQLLKLTADLTHFPIMMCKDVMQNNPRTL